MRNVNQEFVRSVYGASRRALYVRRSNSGGYCLYIVLYRVLQMNEVVVIVRVFLGHSIGSTLLTFTSEYSLLTH